MDDSENTGSCREEDQGSLQRKKSECVPACILCGDAAIDTQECDEWK